MKCTKNFDITSKCSTSGYICAFCTTNKQQKYLHVQFTVIIIVHQIYSNQNCTPKKEERTLQQWKKRITEISSWKTDKLNINFLYIFIFVFFFCFGVNFVGVCVPSFHISNL